MKFTTNACHLRATCTITKPTPDQRQTSTTSDTHTNTNIRHPNQHQHPTPHSPHLPLFNSHQPSPSPLPLTIYLPIRKTVRQQDSTSNMARLTHAPVTPRRSVSGPDSLTDLTRLLDRLQQSILHADAERERRLRTSEYERNKAGIVSAAPLLARREEPPSRLTVLPSLP